MGNSHRRKVRAFPETGDTDYTRTALSRVVEAVGPLTPENRRRVIYATAVFYGILPIEVEAPRQAKQAAAQVVKLPVKKSGPKSV